MLSPSVLQLSQFLEDQFVWLSIGAWAVLLWWLWPRLSRRRVLLWCALVGVLHLTPLLAQLMRAVSAITGLASDVPMAFWALQGMNLLALGLIFWTWYAAHGRSTRLRQVQTVQAVQAVLAERRRIANDLHDGVGSRLVALLASQRPGAAGPDELATALHDCLLELHMTVDDLDDQSCATLVERLAHLRYRLQPAFDRMGVVLVWNIGAGAQAQACALSPETAMQVCRVAQEALSNALRHSRASRVELRFGPQGRTRALVLEIADDGCGLQASADLPAQPLGKGLRSMRARARAVHGDLSIMAVVPQGLCIRLSMPCEEVAVSRTPPELASML